MLQRVYPEYAWDMAAFKASGRAPTGYTRDDSNLLRELERMAVVLSLEKVPIFPAPPPNNPLTSKKRSLTFLSFFGNPLCYFQARRLVFGYIGGLARVRTERDKQDETSAASC